MTALDPAPSILLVGEPSPLLTAVTLVLERAGEQAVPARHAASARMILAAAPGIDTLICGCDEAGEHERELLLHAFQDRYPALARIGLCAMAHHSHTDVLGCRYLVAPFEAEDVRRALAAARLEVAMLAPPAPRQRGRGRSST